MGIQNKTKNETCLGPLGTGAKELPQLLPAVYPKVASHIEDKRSNPLEALSAVAVVATLSSISEKRVQAWIASLPKKD